MDPFGARSRLTQPNAPFQTSPLRNESFRSSEESWLDRPDRRFSDTAVLQSASSGSAFISPTKISPTDRLSQTETSAGASPATSATLRYSSPVDLSTIAHSFTFTDPSSQQSRSSSTSRARTSRSTGRKSTGRPRGRSLFRRASMSVEDKELERKQRELLDSIFGPPLHSQQPQQPQQPQHWQDVDLLPSHRTVLPVETDSLPLSRVEPNMTNSQSNSQQPSGSYQQGSGHQRHQHMYQQRQQQRESQFEQSVFKVPELPASSQSGRALHHPTLEPSSMPDSTMMQGIVSSSVVPQTGWLEALTTEPGSYGDNSRQYAGQHLSDPSSQVYPLQPPHANSSYPPLPARSAQAANATSASTSASTLGLVSGPGTSAAQPRPVQATPSHVPNRHPHEPWNLRGSCACFHVQYSIHVPPAQLPLLASYCHCTVCRSLSGSNYVAFASIPTAQLRWYAGMPDWRTGRGVDVTEELAAARWRLACGLEGKASGADYASDMSMMMTSGALDSPNFTTVADRDGAVGDAIRLWSGADRDAVRGSCVRCGSTLFIGYHKEKVVPSLLASPSPPMPSSDQRSQQSQMSPHAPAGMSTVGVARRAASVGGYASPHPSPFSPRDTAYSPGPVLGSRHAAGAPPVTTGRFSQPGTSHYHHQHHQQSSPAHNAYHPQALPADTQAQPQQQQLRKQQAHYYKTAASITDVALGSLCDAEDRGVRLVRPVCHVMLRERACWDDLPDDGLLRFDGLPGEGRRSKASMPKPKRPGEDDDDDDDDDDDEDEDDGNDKGNGVGGENSNASGWGGAGSSRGAGNSGGGSSTGNQGARAAESRNNSWSGAGGGSSWATWDFGLSWGDGGGKHKGKADTRNNFDATGNQNGKYSKGKGKGREGSVSAAAAAAGGKQGRGERGSSISSSSNASTTAAAAKSVDESMRNLGYLMKCVWVYGGY